MSNQAAAAPCGQLTYQERLHQGINTLISAPLSLALVTCYSLSLIINLLTLSDRNPVESLVSILHNFGIFDQQVLSPLTQLSSTINLVQLFLLIPGIVVAAGMWTIYLDAHTKKNTRMASIGFTAIQIVKFNQFVISIVALPVIVIKGRSILDDLKDFVSPLGFQDIVQWIDVSKTLLVVLAIGLFIFGFQMIVSATVMKESVCNNVAIKNVSVYSAVVCLIAGIACFVFQIKFGFELNATLSGCSAILFGAYFLYYRFEMAKLESSA